MGRIEKKVLVYGVGYPGSGKSTALKSALADISYREISKPVPLVVYDNGMLLLGQWRDGLNPGTDALEFAVKPKVLDWIRRCQPGFIIAEGIRLANRAFFDACKSMGYKVHIVYFDVPVDVAQKRYVQRGSGWDKKKELFHKGVCTQIDHLNDVFTKRIDSTREGNEVAAELRTFLHCEFASVRGDCVWGDWSEEDRNSLFAQEEAKKAREAALAEKRKRSPARSPPRKAEANEQATANAVEASEQMDPTRDEAAREDAPGDEAQGSAPGEVIMDVD